MKHFTSINQFISRKPFIQYKGSINLLSTLQIESIIKRFDKNYLINRKKEMVTNLLKYNVDGDWVERLIKSEFIGKDGFSLESCKLRYGNVGEKIYRDRISKVMSKKENYTTERWKEICDSKRSNLGLDGYIKKYGEIDGGNRWKEYLRKWKIGIEKKKINGWKSGCTLANLQQLHGIKDGYNIWKNKSIKHKKSLSLSGYIDKYGNNNGRKMWEKTCKNRSITSLTSFIDRYGVNDGTRRYNEMSQRLSYVNTLPHYVEKYGKKLGPEKYKEWIIKCTEHKFNGYSKISQRLFWEIYENVNDKIKTLCHFHDLDYEVYFFVNKEWAKIIYVDFKCKNAIIEFDGEYWHSLPYHIKRDKEKNKFLKNRKYNLLRVKETDFINNKQKIIDKCIKFIKKNYERP